MCLHLHLLELRLHLLQAQLLLLLLVQVRHGLEGARLRLVGLDDEGRLLGLRRARALHAEADQVDELGALDPGVVCILVLRHVPRRLGSVLCLGSRGRGRGLLLGCQAKWIDRGLSLLRGRCLCRRLHEREA